jgi:formylglycine-generating enzyme required for sulfatase activity
MTMRVILEPTGRGLALRTALICACVAATVRLAGADPGGHARRELTFAGSLRQGGACAPATRLTFRFHRDGSAAPLCAGVTELVTPAAGTCGFVARIPTADCPASLFDGSNTLFDVLADGGAVIASDQRVTPVPYARYAEQLGTADCPVGYDRAVDAATPAGRWFCRRGSDEVVRVGDGPSAFWIDRYEASVWTTADGPASGTQRFLSDNDFPAAFPRNGQWRDPSQPTAPTPLYAASVAGQQPARSITWFQAVEACRASGKRLPTDEEWLTAANGTPDPGDHNGDGGRCRTGNGATAPRNTGLGTICRSGWGAQDMIGNVWELSSEWHAGAGTNTARVNVAVQNWPADYNNDATWNINGLTAALPSATGAVGVPAVSARGGGFGENARAGVFALSLDNAPSLYGSTIGFRCVVSR